jgi:hypothetical protein
LVAQAIRRFRKSLVLFWINKAVAAYPPLGLPELPEIVAPTLLSSLAVNTAGV